MKIIIILLLGVVLLVGISMLRFLLLLLVSRSQQREFIKRFFPFVELMAWLAFVFWAIKRLVGIAPFYSYVVGFLGAVIIIGFGWYALRDLIAGVVLKARGGLVEGASIATPQGVGTVRTLGYLSLDIEGDGGNTIQIPYSLLTSNSIIQQPQRGQVQRHTITLEIPISMPPQATQEAIRRKILEMPWIVITKEIGIEIETLDAQYRVKVTFHSIHDDMLARTHAILKDALLADS